MRRPGSQLHGIAPAPLVALVVCLASASAGRGVAAAEKTSESASAAPAGDMLADGGRVESPQGIAKLPGEGALADDETALFGELPSVFAASKYDQRLIDAPSSVTVVTEEEIRRFGYRTLAEVLAGVRSFQISDDRNYSYVGVRGYGIPGDYNSRVLLLVDGTRVNDTVFNTAAVGGDALVGIHDVDRIEIVRGPGSSLFGSNAFFAVINVITKRGRHLKGIEAEVGGGSHSTMLGRLAYGDRLQNGLELYLSASGLQSNGATLVFDNMAEDRVVVRGADGEKHYNLLQRLSWGSLAVASALVSRTKHIPTGSYGTILGDPRALTRDDSGYIEASFRDLVGNSTELDARTSLHWYTYRGVYPYAADIDMPAGSIMRDGADNQFIDAEVRLSHTLPEALHLTGGAELVHSLRQDQFERDATMVMLDDHRRSAEAALYMQAETLWWSIATFSVGGRIDWERNFGLAASPRLALVLHPRESLAIKLIGGRAFRAPNAYELYYGNAYDTTLKRPESLRPESITTHEVTAELTLAGGGRIVASTYFNDLRGLIKMTEDPHDGMQVFRNAGRAWAAGAEVELEASLARVDLRASYSFQHAEDGQSGATLVNSPAHMVKVLASSPLVPEDWMRLAVELAYTSPRATLGGRRSTDPVIMNMTLSTSDFFGAWRASVSLYNLLDQRVTDVGSAEHLQDLLPRNGRTLRAELSYSL